ncbi:MAG: hypothetical protein QM770_16400 [Tepidisphaeraceae bacterium]
MRDVAQLVQIVRSLEGSLTASVYTAHNTDDDEAYEAIASHSRQRVGRLLNNKMPTGVTVSPAMNHGGPMPATANAGFTAVGFPGAMRRFAKLDCYERVRDDRLPLVLRDGNPLGAWRLVDGAWTREKAK